MSSKTLCDHYTISSKNRIELIRIIKKDSSINEIIKNSSILVKNKYNRYEHRINTELTPKISIAIVSIIRKAVIEPLKYFSFNLPHHSNIEA